MRRVTVTSCNAALFRRPRQPRGPASYQAGHQETGMPQKITLGYKAMLEAAEKEIETLSVDEAAKLHGNNDVVFVDIRDPRELQREGKMPGAFHATRGMLEFWIDPESPYHKDIFAQ